MVTVPPFTGRFVPILTVRDLARSAEWYARVFTLERHHEYRDAQGRLRDVSLHDEATGLQMALVDHDANLGDPFDEHRTGLDHLEFLVTSKEDLDDWAQHLDALGVEHSGVKSPSYTRNAMLTFRDPDNIQLELFWWAPPA